MTGSEKARRLLTDIGLPVPERARTPLLAVNDQIVWVVGHAIAARAAVTP